MTSHSDPLPADKSACRNRSCPNDYCQLQQARAIIDKAAEDLRKATTLTYEGDNPLSLNRAIDQVCDRVSRIISDLEQRPK